MSVSSPRRGRAALSPAKSALSRAKGALVSSLVVVAVGTSAGCVATPADLPPGAVLYCASDVECPAGWVCRETVGRCFSTEGLDETPPGVADAAGLDATVLGLGRTATLTFSADEPLAALPDVRLGDHAAFTLAGESAVPGAGPFTFTYTAGGTEPAGMPMPVVVRLLDVSGLESEVEVGELRFDFTPPAVVGEAVIAPSHVRARVPVEIELDTSEALGSAPVVELRPTDDPEGVAYPLEVVTSAGASHQLRFTPTGSEEEGTYVASVELVDEAGNVARYGLGDVVFDFNPPGLLPGVDGLQVSYQASPGSIFYGVPEFAPQAAALGTVVTLRFRADEPIDTAAPVDVWIDAPLPSPEAPGLTDLVFLPVDEVLATEERFLVEAEVGPPLLLPNGEYTPQIAFQDLAGNRTVVALDATVHLRTQSPSLVVDQDAIVHVRSPYPKAGPEVLGPGVIVPDPASPNIEAFAFSAVMPGDPLANVPGIPASALAHDDGSTVIGALVSLDPGGQLVIGGLPRMVSNQGFFRPGYWPVLYVDHLYLAGVDVAGNVTAPVLIETVEWVAHPGVEGFGAASALYAQSETHGHVLPDEETVTVANPLADFAPATWTDDATDVLEATTGARLVPIDSGGLTPFPAVAPGLTYDLFGGQVVLFGGGAEGSDVERTWVFRDHRFHDVTPSGLGASPSPRDGPSLVFDRARGRTVLFGGSILGYHLPEDTWELGGGIWVPAGDNNPRPPGRFFAGMVYDAAREVVVLYGGGSFNGNQVIALDDHWEWDGREWSEVPKPLVGPWPGPRVLPRMAYDEEREVVVLYRGEPSAQYSTFPPVADEADTVWEYDGMGWTSVNPAGVVVPPIQMPFWHPTLGRVTSLEVAADGTWNLRSWNGSAWENTGDLDGAEVPAIRVLSSSFYDVAEDELVLLGGSVDPAATAEEQTAVWTFGPLSSSSATWRRIVARPTALPQPRTLAAMALDPSRAAVVLLGGSMTPPIGDLDEGHSTVWELSESWSETLPSGLWPESRVGAAAAFEPTSGQVIYVGGVRDGDNDPDTPVDFLAGTWLWDGASWTDPAPTTAPPPLMSAALATDPLLGAVMFGGGNEQNQPTAATWRFANGDWTLLTPSVSPPPRTAAAMAYDPLLDVVVLFGGADAAGYLGDTWTWDGTAWTAVAAPGPPARGYHALAFDEARAQIILTGGIGEGGFFGDIWAYDETGWALVSSETGTPVYRWAHTAAFDPTREKTVVQGGISQNLVLQSGTYELTSPDPGAMPAVTFVANGAVSGVRRNAVTSVRVRARCGGEHAPYGPSDVGAALYVWQARSLSSAGGWLEPVAFGDTQTSSGPGDVLDLIDVTIDDPTLARSLLLERDRAVIVQCRPRGPAGEGRARVAGSFAEVRVRYTVDAP